MAEAWKKAGTTDTEKTIAALESDVSLPDAPGGPWIMRGKQHHAAMHTYLFKVKDDHSLELVSDLGMTEPQFLSNIGVDMTKKAPNRQFLPADNPEWKKYLAQ